MAESAHGGREKSKGGKKMDPILKIRNLREEIKKLVALEEVILSAAQRTTTLIDAIPKTKQSKSRVEEYAIKYEEVHGRRVQCELALLKEQTDLLEALTEHVHERVLDAMKLRYIDELTIAEIAAQMNCSERQVNRLLAGGRLTMKEVGLLH